MLAQTASEQQFSDYLVFALSLASFAIIVFYMLYEGLYPYLWHERHQHQTILEYTRRYNREEYDLIRPHVEEAMKAADQAPPQTGSDASKLKLLSKTLPPESPEKHPVAYQKIAEESINVGFDVPAEAKELPEADSTRPIKDGQGAQTQQRMRQSRVRET